MKIKPWIATVLGIVMLSSGCSKSDRGYKPEDYITLGEYKGIEVTEVSKEPTEEDLQTKINSILTENSEYQEVNRPIQMYDFININLTGSIDKVEESGFTVNNYEIYLGFQPYVMEGFAEKLIGMESGKTHELAMIIPDSFEEKALRGKEVVFSVTINKVRGSVLKDFTDDFVKEISEYETVEEYKIYLMDVITKEKEKEALNIQKNEAWNILVERTECTGYPDGMIEVKQKELTEQFTQIASVYGNTIDEFIQKNYGMSMEEYVKFVCKQDLMFELLADKEKITVTEKEYENDLERFAANMGSDDKNSFEQEYGKEKIQKAMLWDKIQNCLLEQAVIK